MIYRNFQDKELSLLGFGAMRLPTMSDGSIDQPQVEAMVDYAIGHGINYFDTAYPYHGGHSEISMGKALAKHPRDQWYLATKFPGHQISASYDPKAIFEEQLQKCGVDYFDFYLLHNVYENSIETYMDPQWDILGYFKEQKRLGRIKHLGFSTHGGISVLERFLDYCGDDMEFCQIQLNYLDWTLQDAKRKYELLTERGIPVWVMEPVRGGRLCQLSPEETARLQAADSKATVPSWGFRFLQDLPNVTMILSGMSNLQQMQENICTFETHHPLKPEETALLLDLAEGMKDSLPCTGCRYCTDGCPMGLDIPMLLSIYNDLRFSPVLNASMRIECLPAEKQPSACIGCGACSAVCPQKIQIPQALSDLAQRLQNLPTWVQMCREREAAARALKNNSTAL